MSNPVRDDLLQSFFLECGELLAQVEEVVLELEESADRGEAINRAFRIFHSIKGSAAMSGLTDISRFTHHLETVLDKCRAGKLAISPELIDVVLASKDHIEALVAAAKTAGESPPAGDALVAALSALAPPPEAKVVAADKPKPPARFAIEIRPSGWIADTTLRALFDELGTLGPCDVTAVCADVPPIDLLDVATCSLSWRLELVTTSPIETIRDRFIFIESDAAISIEEEFFFGDEDASVQLFDDLDLAASIAPKPVPVEKLIVPPPTHALTIGPPSPAMGGVSMAPAAKPVETMVRVSSEKLDRLVNLVSELVITQSRLVQVASRIPDAELANPVEEIDRLVVELREGVLGIRMMQIGSAFGRFKRLVHDLSAQLEKKVDFITEGAETELDKSVLDQLVDPLMHLIRNSLDHGIESAADRAAAGKPERGTVRLTASHVGQRVVITIKDDGKGLDAEAIRTKAVQRGLISPEQSLADADLFKLIFEPGFSTAKTLSDVSGRGVGMDVVRRQIEALRGSVKIASERGHGSTMSLELPLTLAIIDGLLVEIGSDRFIVPMSAVTENVELPAGDRQRHNGRQVVLVRQEFVPYVSLRDLFESDAPECADEKVVILELGDDRVGLVVDRVIGSHQTVIQPLGPMYRNVDVVSGATIMGDGRVALILDLAGIVRVNTERDEATKDTARARAA